MNWSEAPRHGQQTVAGDHHEGKSPEQPVAELRRMLERMIERTKERLNERKIERMIERMIERTIERMIELNQRRAILAWVHMTTGTMTRVTPTLPT